MAFVTETLECLRCGETRSDTHARARAGSTGECPRCGYLGWARTGELTEDTRRLLRSRPPERRRLHARF